MSVIKCEIQNVNSTISPLTTDIFNDIFSIPCNNGIY